MKSDRARISSFVTACTTGIAIAPMRGKLTVAPSIAYSVAGETSNRSPTDTPRPLAHSIGDNRRLPAGWTAVMRTAPRRFCSTLVAAALALACSHAFAQSPDADDERRNYYRITHAGLRVARAEARRLNALMRAARLGGLLAKDVK